MIVDGRVACACIEQGCACPPADQVLASERIGTRGEVLDLRAALEAEGAAYPVLLAALPANTEGEAPAALAKSAIAEIERLRHNERWVYRIVDEDSNAPAQIA